jgi:hypothetical protein
MQLAIPKHEHNQVILTSHPDDSECKLTLRFKDNLERDLFTLAFRVLRERASPIQEKEEAKAEFVREETSRRSHNDYG